MYTGICYRAAATKVRSVQNILLHWPATWQTHLLATNALRLAPGLLPSRTFNRRFKRMPNFLTPPHAGHACMMRAAALGFRHQHDCYAGNYIAPIYWPTCQSVLNVSAQCQSSMCDCPYSETRPVHRKFSTATHTINPSRFPIRDCVLPTIITTSLAARSTDALSDEFCHRYYNVVQLLPMGAPLLTVCASGHLPTWTTMFASSRGLWTMSHRTRSKPQHGTWQA